MLFLMISMVIEGLINVCLQNCYIGKTFYSAPLDENGCCRYEWSKNCNKYVTTASGKFICDRCQIGYKWYDNDCRKMSMKEICINPEMKFIPFQKCRICRFNSKHKFIPIFNKKT